MSSRFRQLLPNAFKNILRPVYRYSKHLRYKRWLWRLQVSKQQLLILATIPRSGTHYMKFLLANYVKLLSNENSKPVDAGEMNSMLPNLWHRTYLNFTDHQTPTRLLDSIGLHDIPRSHIEYMHPYWDKSRVIHLYRNPLDFAVSFYFYKYENRSGLKGTVSGPAEVMEKHFEYYIKMYLSYRDVAHEGNASLLRISYEDLVRYPQFFLGMILRWIGVEPKPSLLDAAVRHSSRDTMRRLEKNNPINPRAKDLNGNFVRNGGIGQWKEYFDSSDVSKIERKLSRVGIKLKEFVLEA